MLKNKDLFGLQQGLAQCKNLIGVKFAYAIAKNHAKIDSEIEALREAVKPTSEFEVYDKERAELAKSFADKDDKGEPKINVIPQTGLSEYVIPPAKKKAFNKAFENLKRKNKKVVDAKNKQIEEYNKLLEEESKIELHKVNVELVPQDITVGQMELIMPIIDDANLVKSIKKPKS